MKNSKVLLLLCFSFFLSELVIGQEKVISGIVTSKNDGMPLPGAGVHIKGTSNGVETDFDGKYEIKASIGDTLIFTYVGMITKSMVISSEESLNVSLEDSNILDEVVVTALGIKKTRKSLTYAAQDIDAKELSKIKQTNPVNSLSGKVSGVNITRSSSGAGGSVKVVLRGNSSIGNNQPLYVVDGIPLNNPSSGQPDSTFGSTSGGNTDGGDVLSLINPDDIESITVLKGASASALYGNAGLNGVIVINTKKGKSGAFKVDFSSNLVVENAAYFMNFNEKTQRTIDNFFRAGTTNINSLSISGGTDKAQTYFSYSNSFVDGVLPTNSLRQHSFSVRETAKLFEDKITLNANVLGSTQSISNRPISGLYFNPLVGVYNFESSTEDLSDYKVFEVWNPYRDRMTQRWYRGPGPEEKPGTFRTSDIEQNPYWILHRNASSDQNDKLIASLNLNFKINDWLSLQTRGTYDQSVQKFEKRIYASTQATLAHENGRYIVRENEFVQLYGDIIANINTQITDNLSLTAIIGGATKRNTSESLIADSGTIGGLQFANFFAIQNFNSSAGVSIGQNGSDIKENSLFGSTTLNYDEKLFLDLTYRKDWSSTLTKPFDYPSVGLTGVLSEIFDLGKNISFAKVRASYAEVGNGFGFNQIIPNDDVSFGGNPLIDNPQVFPGFAPLPETQTSYEVGTEWKFFNNRLGFDFGYYNTKTKDQYYPYAVSVAIWGNPIAYLNSGEITNSGVEASFFGTILDKEKLRWKTSFNFAANRNKINRIYNGVRAPGLIEPKFFTLSPKGVNTFGSYLVEGGSFGDIYAQVVKRNENGLPIVTVDNSVPGQTSYVIQREDAEVDGLTKVGNANPDFTLGWNNSFQLGSFSLDVLIDGKFGGETMSLTEAVVEGGSNNSARETTNANVAVAEYVRDSNNNIIGTKEFTLPAQTYYGLTGGRNSFTGEYIYSATNVRLAEFALGYDFKLSENSFFRRVKASLIGNNLFFFYKEAPHDPNLSLSTGNALQGVDVLGLPSTRSIGLNVNLSF
ncbi:MAG TPA: hypothetical protein DDY16_05950 [Tenacibaculum sp.]|nr:hypothetical protein [Tenacibaculum sp.]HBI40474.1 hypothetical protein [Tenacibaculum sp.]